MENRLTLRPIGRVRTAEQQMPRHHTMSQVEGELVLEEQYREGLRDIQPGQRLVVLFWFHQSPAFTPINLIQKPPHLQEERGVFSTCSPGRPNPVGVSVVEVLGVTGTTIRVKGLDMRDGTPILDLKPDMLHGK